MTTILISSHDTVVGKTWVARAIVQQLLSEKRVVQVVKPVETGVVACNVEMDAHIITKGLDPAYVTAYTLYSFDAPLAPVSSAREAGIRLNFNEIIEKIRKLPEAPWRIIETAGGIAVPLEDSGKDGRDLAATLNVDYIVLVLQNRLGAINQGRLLDAYMKGFSNAGFWLNDTAPRDTLVTQSNIQELKSLKTPIWAHQGFENYHPEFCNAPFLNS